jgi:uncharacterized protein YprB with RNaseH-like and TPR domain
MRNPKIFLFDIETAPINGYVWSIWKQNVGLNQIVHDWRMLTWAGKWLDEDEVLYDSCHYYPDHTDDTPILETLHQYLDDADIVVAHNGNKFDMKKVNARFLQAGMDPPSPYRKIDTLLEVKKNFAFTSNRLDAIGKALGLGGKAETGGFELWTGCMNGDKESYEKMVEYNIRDITLLEDVYLALRPWMHNHPNVAVYNDEEAPECPKCGSQHLHWRGYATTNASRFRRFQCLDCGGWGRERVNTIPKGSRKGLMANVL